MNKAILIGNLANDPETRTTQSGIAQCTFRLAVQRRFANQNGVREADFLTIVCWRQTAELCSRYLSKGRKVAVVGRVSASAFQGQDGSPRASLEVFAEEVEFLSSRSDDGAAYTPAAPASKPAAPADNGFKEVDDEDLPF